jgi:aspartate/glutamate/glutamine transport system permease protein
MKRGARWALAVPIVALAFAGFLALVYRMYAPGDLAARVDRLQARWSIFGDLRVWRGLLRGLATTLELAVVSILLSLVLAVVLALLRLAPHPRMRAPIPGAAIVARATGTLVEIIRSSPLFMLIIYTFIALPKVGVDLSPFTAGVVALTLYTSCVTSEIVRAGILSLDRGQFDAGLSLGLGYFKRVRFIVLPQALRRMVPAIVSQLVTLIKDTSLVSFITVLELARRGQILAQYANNPIETSLVVMAMYFVINFALSQLSTRLEVRPGRVGRAKAPAAIGAEDQIPTVT